MPSRKHVRKRARLLPPLNALRVFEAAARLESFKDAATELSLSQPAVSRQINLLEEWLGHPLFVRRNREVVLTVEGRVFMEEVTPALDKISLATSVIMRKRSAETLLIDVPPTFAVRWLIPRLPPFVRQFPGVEIRLTTSTEPVDLGKGNVDMAIRRLPADDARYHCRAFMPERLLPVCSPAVVERSPLQSPGELVGHTLIQSETTPDAWRDWLKSMGCEDMPPAQSLKFETLNYTIEAALNGMGMAIVPAALIIDEVAAGTLVCPFKAYSSRYGDYRLLSTPDRSQRDAVTAFSEWIIAEGRSCRALIDNLLGLGEQR
ncbi:transcriptional regulator GcvA [Pigmentiphaga soli]